MVFRTCIGKQYSKIGNTREQLFAETIDTYVNHTRQVVTLLGYQEPQILEVF